MIAVLDELGLTELVTSIQGLTAVGAATLLAKTGDLTRFASPRAVVKTRRAVPAAQRQRGPPVQDLAVRARPTELGLPPGAQCGRRCPTTPSSPRGSTTSPPGEQLTGPPQARAACAAALLRWLHVVVTRGVAWNQAIAAGDKQLPRAA
jgi:transposase